MNTVKPTIGRIVHYVLREGRSAGESRAAIVVRVWGDDTSPNLQVYLDGSNDDGSEFRGAPGDRAPAFGWATSVPFDDPAEMAEHVSEGDGKPGYQPGSWHWPPR